MGARNEACDIEELNWDRSFALHAGAVVRFTSIRYVEASAGAGDLEIADASLWVDGCESG